MFLGWLSYLTIRSPSSYPPLSYIVNLLHTTLPFVNALQDLLNVAQCHHHYFCSQYAGIFVSADLVCQRLRVMVFRWQRIFLFCRIEELTNEKAVYVREQQETIRQLTKQNENISTTFKVFWRGKVWLCVIVKKNVSIINQCLSANN